MKDDLNFILHPSAFILRKEWSGSVSRILFPSRGEDHSSATRVAAVVKQPTRKLFAETGGSNASLFGLAPQGVCRAVAAHAGRGALLPHRFTLASLRLAASGSAVCSLLHFPSRCRAWPLASLLPVGVRTFLPFDERGGDPPIRSTFEDNRAARHFSPGSAAKLIELNHC
jgi:hypothetical protein